MFLDEKILVDLQFLFEIVDLQPKDFRDKNQIVVVD